MEIIATTEPTPMTMPKIVRLDLALLEIMAKKVSSNKSVINIKFIL
jgi:hypothetical protein